MTVPEFFIQMQRRQQAASWEPIHEAIIFKESAPPYGDPNYLNRRPIEAAPIPPISYADLGAQIAASPGSTDPIKEALRMINQYKTENPGMTFEEAVEHHMNYLKDSKTSKI